MAWLKVPDVLRRVNLSKLSSLTLEKGEKVTFGTPDGIATTFALPFAWGKTGAKVYVNGTEDTTATISEATGPNGEDEVTFLAAPLAGDALSASAVVGANVVNLFNAIERAQGTIKGYARQAGYTIDDTNVPDGILKSWAWDLGAYVLVSDLRRAPLSESYPDLKKRYDLAMDEIRDMVKGDFTLEGSATLDDTKIDLGVVAAGDSPVFGGSKGFA